MTASIGYDCGGSYVEWYMDDDGGSGYGDNARRTRWYDKLETCRRLVQGGPPAGCRWTTMQSDPVQPGSAEWCETYADNQ